MKRALKQLLTAVVAIGLVVSASILSAAQPVEAISFSTIANPAITSSAGSALLANAGGKDLRNSVDDKLATEYGNKIDVNNTNIASFRKYRGLYPTIAGKVVSNAPYENVEDVLDIPNLSAIERDRLEKNMDIFTISAPDPALVEGADRFNNGVYK
ncbi:MAG: photosystem II complex extrinsic protein PsbU [Cyanobacteria bacterium P01_D01_bin.105]